MINKAILNTFFFAILLVLGCSKKPAITPVTTNKPDTVKKDTSTKKDTTGKPPGVPASVNTTFGSNSNSWIIGMHSDQSAQDGGGRVATDISGNIYVLFNFYGELDLDPSASFLLGGGYYDRPNFVKYNSAGKLLWSKQITNFGQIYVNALKTDNQGNVYCSLTCPGASNIQIDGTTYSFNGIHDESVLIKFTSDAQVSWVKDIGVTYPDLDLWVNDLTIDSKQNVYIAGSHFGQVDFYGSTNHVLDSSSTSSVVIYFWAKFDVNGNFVTVKDAMPAATNTYYGGTYLPFGDSPTHIAVDENQNVFICGLATDDTTSVPKLVSSSLALGGQFVTKYDNKGNWIWLKGYHGTPPYSTYPVITNLLADNNGNIYLYGNNGTNGIVTGDILGKLNAATGGDIWYQNISTSVSDSQPTMKFDYQSNITVAGNCVTNNISNLYIVSFSPAGTQLFRKNIAPYQAGKLNLYDISPANTAFINIIGLYTGGVDILGNTSDPINSLTDANTGLFIAHIPDSQ